MSQIIVVYFTALYSGVATNLIGGWGGYVLTTVFIAISKRVNVPHVNKTVTDFGGI